MTDAPKDETELDPFRVERAVIALHDYGSRKGATAKKVRAQMRRAGFTLAEIAAAARRWE